MSRTNIKARSGNRMQVRFDNQQIGLVQNLRGSDDYGPEPASGIGDIHVAEYVPTMARHTVSASAMVLYTGAMREAGISFVNGDDALRGNVFDIVVVDKESGAELRKYIDCSYASGDIEVNKHAIVVTNATFNALDVTGTGL